MLAKASEVRTLFCMRMLHKLMCVLVVIGCTSATQADQNSARLDDLFDQLSKIQESAEARPIEREIWRIWGLPGDAKASVPLAQGILNMTYGELPEARNRFDQVVAIAPDFAEGWNKRATVAYMQGDFETSVRDIQRTLALEPRHFGALSGLALIYENLGRHETALDVILQVKEIYPSMPGIDERMTRLRKAIKDKRT